MFSGDRSESKSTESLSMQLDEGDRETAINIEPSDTREVASSNFISNDSGFNVDSISSIYGEQVCTAKESPIPMEQLHYAIHSYSSHLQNYSPQNIKDDKPHDSSSRWTSSSVDPPQYIVLKFACPVVVGQITFGKYEKAHACNMKRFKVYAGMSEETMNHEILDGTLRNDSTSETFNLKYSIEGHVFASRFIKIVPIVSWGGTFNHTIWHVSLHGTSDASIVSSAMSNFDRIRQEKALKLCMKFLRQANYLKTFDALTCESDVSFEDDILAKLHRHLVVEGDFVSVEKLLDHCFECGYFDDYLSQQSYQAVWTLLEPKGSKEDRPGMRGGHQMAIDSVDQKIYLFGGWDGTLDLSDFWVYDIHLNQWTCLSTDTSLTGGPSPRSCHKMVIDELRKKIYLLGRYLDSNSRTAQNIKADFYVYSIESDTWHLICDDTASLGGPKLIFDHQLALDSKSNQLYVFGGRVILPATMPADTSSTSISPPIISPVSLASRFFIYDSNPLSTPTVASTSSSPPAPAPLNASAASEASTGASDFHPIFDSLIRNFNAERVNFSGMYSYDIASNTWKCLRQDSLMATTTYNFINSGQSRADLKNNCIYRNTIRSRVGHSMVLHEGLSKLYIFAGQCNNEYMADFIEFNLITNEVAIKNNSSDGKNGDVSSSPVIKRDFTQRATIDEQLNEIYVFSGITNDAIINSQSPVSGQGNSNVENNNVIPSAKLGDMSKVKNSFWVYSINRASWNCVYRNEFSSASSASASSSSPSTSSSSSSDSTAGGSPACPCPRYAHSLVYDKTNKMHYLFGGNPGSGVRSHETNNLRLDDFWSLKLIRPSPSALRCKLIQLLRQVSVLKYNFIDILCNFIFIRSLSLSTA